jgi:hypothetical protein
MKAITFVTTLVTLCLNLCVSFHVKKQHDKQRVLIVTTYQAKNRIDESEDHQMYHKLQDQNKHAYATKNRYTYFADKKDYIPDKTKYATGPTIVNTW